MADRGHRRRGHPGPRRVGRPWEGDRYDGPPNWPMSASGRRNWEQKFFRPVIIDERILNELYATVRHTVADKSRLDRVRPVPDYDVHDEQMLRSFMECSPATVASNSKSAPRSILERHSASQYPKSTGDRSTGSIFARHPRLNRLFGGDVDDEGDHLSVVDEIKMEPEPGTSDHDHQQHGHSSERDTRHSSSRRDRSRSCRDRDAGNHRASSICRHDRPRRDCARCRLQSDRRRHEQQKLKSTTSSAHNSSTKDTAQQQQQQTSSSKNNDTKNCDNVAEEDAKLKSGENEAAEDTAVDTSLKVLDADGDEDEDDVQPEVRLSSARQLLDGILDDPSLDPLYEEGDYNDEESDHDQGNGNDGNESGHSGSQTDGDEWSADDEMATFWTAIQQSTLATQQPQPSTTVTTEVTKANDGSDNEGINSEEQQHQDVDNEESLEHEELHSDTDKEESDNDSDSSSSDSTNTSSTRRRHNERRQSSSRQSSSRQRLRHDERDPLMVSRSRQRSMRHGSVSSSSSRVRHSRRPDRRKRPDVNDVGKKTDVNNSASSRHTVRHSTADVKSDAKNASSSRSRVSYQAHYSPVPASKVKTEPVDNVPATSLTSDPVPLMDRKMLPSLLDSLIVTDSVEEDTPPSDTHNVNDSQSVSHRHNHKVESHPQPVVVSHHPGRNGVVTIDAMEQGFRDQFRAVLEDTQQKILAKQRSRKSTNQQRDLVREIMPDYEPLQDHSIKKSSSPSTTAEATRSAAPASSSRHQVRRNHDAHEQHHRHVKNEMEHLPKKTSWPLKKKLTNTNAMPLGTREHASMTNHIHTMNSLNDQQAKQHHRPIDPNEPKNANCVPLGRPIHLGTTRTQQHPVNMAHSSEKKEMTSAKPRSATTSRRSESSDRRHRRPGRESPKPQGQLLPASARPMSKNELRKREMDKRKHRQHVSSHHRPLDDGTAHGVRASSRTRQHSAKRSRSREHDHRRSIDSKSTAKSILTPPRAAASTSQWIIPKLESPVEHVLATQHQACLYGGAGMDPLTSVFSMSSSPPKSSTALHQMMVSPPRPRLSPLPPPIVPISSPQMDPIRSPHKRSHSPDDVRIQQQLLLQQQLEQQQHRPATPSQFKFTANSSPPMAVGQRHVRNSSTERGIKPTEFSFKTNADKMEISEKRTRIDTQADHSLHRSIVHSPPSHHLPVAAPAMPFKLNRAVFQPKEVPSSEHRRNSNVVGSTSSQPMASTKSESIHRHRVSTTSSSGRSVHRRESSSSRSRRSPVKNMANSEHCVEVPAGPAMQASRRVVFNSSKYPVKLSSVDTEREDGEITENEEKAPLDRADLPLPNLSKRIVLKR